MRSWRIPLLAVMLVAAACGGATTTSTSSPDSTAGTTTTLGATTPTTGASSFTVVSEDGDLEVEVPREAMAEDPGITITILDPADYPPEFAPFADAGSVIYSLQPDGLTFDAPVRVTRRIPAARFTGLPEGSTPVVSLITTKEDGSGFELLGDLRVLRNGDDVFVSGDVTHFSPNAAVNEQFYYTPRYAGYEFTTQVGIPIGVEAEFAGYDGEPLAVPENTMAVGFTRHDDLLAFRLSADYAEVECTGEGEATPRIGFQTEFVVGGQDGTPEPQAIRNFVPEADRLSVMLKVAHPLVCLPQGFHGAETSGAVQTDHPGGIQVVPNGDFRGGLSAGFGWLGGLTAYFEDPHVSLVKDGGNMMLDGADLVFPGVEIEDYDGRDGFVAPLFSYGLYYLLVFDAADFDSLSERDGTLPLDQWLGAAHESHTGDWYVGSIGIVMSGPEAFGYRVDSSEDPQTIEDGRIEVLPRDLWFFGPRVNF